MIIIVQYAYQYYLQRRLDLKHAIISIVTSVSFFGVKEEKFAPFAEKDL